MSGLPALADSVGGYSGVFSNFVKNSSQVDYLVDKYTQVCAFRTLYMVYLITKWVFFIASKGIDCSIINDWIQFPTHYRCKLEVNISYEKSGIGEGE